MPRYTTEKIFTYLETDETLALIVTANGGSLVTSSFDGVGYVTADTINTDLVTEYYVKGQTLKFTPSGGCTFSIRGGT